MDSPLLVSPEVSFKVVRRGGVNLLESSRSRLESQRISQNIPLPSLSPSDAHFSLDPPPGLSQKDNTSSCQYFQKWGIPLVIAALWAYEGILQQKVPNDSLKLVACSQRGFSLLIGLSLTYYQGQLPAKPTDFLRLAIKYLPLGALGYWATLWSLQAHQVMSASAFLALEQIQWLMQESFQEFQSRGLSTNCQLILGLSISQAALLYWSSNSGAGALQWEGIELAGGHLLLMSIAAVYYQGQSWDPQPFYTQLMYTDLGGLGTHAFGWAFNPGTPDSGHSLLDRGPIFWGLLLALVGKVWGSSWILQWYHPLVVRMMGLVALVLLFWIEPLHLEQVVGFQTYWASVKDRLIPGLALGLLVTLILGYQLAGKQASTLQKFGSLGAL